ncbi:hypothetical protein F2Q69_00041231 [Brassica cretica]|uniref:Uncharacterized protein n=1 Tax=Brassica cretica TaxID=69181 RepID=A0A8S9NN46_BRACR|nr:hypothetical protein F2Q69_00041231 [Brassica cretica]
MVRAAWSESLKASRVQNDGTRWVTVQTAWILSDGWVLIDTCGFEFDCGTVGPSQDRVPRVRVCVLDAMDYVIGLATYSRERVTSTRWLEGRMAVRCTDGIEGCRAEYVLTGLGVINDYFWNASKAGVLSVLDGWLETKPSLFVYLVMWGWLAE